MIDTILLVAVSGTSAVLAGAAVRWRMRGRLASMTRAATTDPLTGLSNRAGLAQVAASYTSTSYTLVMVDLDGFKEINDAFGHAAGDAVLVDVAARFAAILAEVDAAVVARLGGDEFVLALPAPESVAELLGEEVVRSLMEPVLLDGGVIEVRASVGAVHVGPGVVLAAALRAADLAVYTVKASGGDGLVVADAAAAVLPSPPVRPRVRQRELAGTAWTLEVPA